MLRRVVLLIALWLAAPTLGADTKPAGGSGEPPKAATKAAPKTSTKAAPKTATQAQVLAVTNAKSGFMAAVRACARPGTCDPASPSADRDLLDLLDRKEAGFMDACLACAEREPCEVERDRIRKGGGGQQGRHPCTPKAK